jgi:hypothetical protein
MYGGTGHHLWLRKKNVLCPTGVYILHPSPEAT